ncbi:MAG TPA: tRNA 2-thiouridine(34) synthase MnmA [Candidatus Paceibacterota bacterium]|nr:tRNA 2-thiouridine(34) synthase MnmA [Candidatus Paceibacterota bacterium]
MRIFVGLSGGVDSATSAALLKAQGHDVVGVFIKIWQPEFIECTWRQDRLDALRVCASFDIPFREVDFSEHYKRDVVEAMIADYQSGITPNPDVLCNEKIKFGSFLDWALAHGADMVATGHYAQTKSGRLFRGADNRKDQSYFLYRLSHAQLEKTLFPIGGMHKDEVRKVAVRFNVPVAQKPDSQGLCFIGDVSMSDFLKRFIDVESGVVLDMQGNQIGEHDGAACYTIGQRHGFRVRNTAAGSSHFVVALDTKHNTITISPRRDDAAKQTISIENVHWITSEPAFPAQLQAQTRYHETPVGVTVTPHDTHLRASFIEPHISAPGQSIVFYGEEECIGGGIISL